MSFSDDNYMVELNPVAGTFTRLRLRTGAIFGHDGITIDRDFIAPKHFRIMRHDSKPKTFVLECLASASYPPVVINEISVQQNKYIEISDGDRLAIKDAEWLIAIVPDLKTIERAEFRYFQTVVGVRAGHQGILQDAVAYHPSKQEGRILTKGIWTVADGVRQCADGKAASQFAVQNIVNRFWQKHSTFENDVVSVTDVLKDAYDNTNKQLIHEAQKGNFSKKVIPYFLTTCVTVVMYKFSWYIAQSGDSHVYYQPGNHGTLTRLTQDHNYAEYLIRVKGKDPGQARAHRHATGLGFCLGISEHYQVDFIETLPVLDEDKILICTDGLTDVIPTGTLSHDMMSYDSTTCVKNWLDKLDEVGTHDDAAIVLISVLDETQKNECLGNVDDVVVSVTHPDFVRYENSEPFGIGRFFNAMFRRKLP